MTTIALVEKDGRIAMAADSQTTFNDDQCLGADNDSHHQKIFRHADSLLAISGSGAHDLVLKAALKKIDDMIGLESAKRDILEKGVLQRPSKYGDGDYAISRRLIEEGRNHLIGDAPFNPGRPIHVLHGLNQHRPGG